MPLYSRKNQNDSQSERDTALLVAVITGFCIHAISDYKKRLYKKRLVDLVLTKKQTLVYLSDLRNAFCRKLFLLKELGNAYTKIYPSFVMQNLLMALFLTDLPKSFKDLGKSFISKSSF